VYQGSISVPDLCHGGKLRLDKGGTLSATLLSISWSETNENGRKTGSLRRPPLARDNGAVSDCVFCDVDRLREAEVCIESEHCIYASTRDPRDPQGVLPGCGVIVPKAHRASPFDLTADEWLSVRDLLLAAKAAWDEQLAPDGYLIGWNASAEPGTHAHLHVVPRFDDEPLAHEGLRSAIKVPGNIRPDPSASGNGRARELGP
jgi:histidine triad (HIT) family protein